MEHVRRIVAEQQGLKISLVYPNAMHTGPTARAEVGGHKGHGSLGLLGLARGRRDDGTKFVRHREGNGRESLKDQRR